MSKDFFHLLRDEGTMRAGRAVTLPFRECPAGFRIVVYEKDMGAGRAACCSKSLLYRPGDYINAAK